MTPFSGGELPGSAGSDRPLRLLLLEDNPGDARLLNEYLEEIPSLDFELTWVRTRGEALEALSEAGEELDLVFLDLSVPDSEGLDTVEPVTAADGDVPVVVLTGREDVQVASDALTEGAQDYLVKAKVGPEDLTRAIRTALERKRVERELRESEERFRQMAENIGEIFYLVDVAVDPPQLLYVNAAFEDIFGMPVERVYDDPTAWQERVHPEDRGRVRKALEELGEGTYEVTYRIRRDDGRDRWISDRAFPVGDTEGAPSRVAGIARDVTEELELRGELEEERAQLQQIVDQAPAFMAVYAGPEHVLERANRAWFELVGDREAVGEPARQIFPEFADQAPLDRLDHVYETGESIRLNREELELESPGAGSRETYYLKISYQPRMRDGQVVGVIVHGVDVTDLVEAHRKVEASRERLEAILGTAAEGIVFTDGEGRIRYANPAAEEIMGLEADEITERGYADPDWSVADLDGNPIPERKLPIARALAEGESVHDVEFSITRGDGRRVVLSVSAAPLRGEDGSPEGAVASFRDVTERKSFERELRHRALHDHLTGLPNRALFGDRLEQTLRRTRRTGEGFALLYLDLKRFKVVNDNLGHAAGDRVLSEVGERLREAVREPDTVARVGGDEFTVLMSSVGDPEGARRGAERIAAALRDPVDVGTTDVPVEATVGVAYCLDREAAEAVDPSELIRRADDAMYQVKDRPGTAYALADPEQEVTGGRIERERALRAALEEGRIRTVYQPLVDPRSGALRGVEALARWFHPERGVVSPAEFIPLAEETGLIIRLGEQQLANACRTLEEVPADGDAPRLHVNLSARQLSDPEVVERVRSVLREVDFRAERLTLEITETAATREPAAVAELRGLGAEIAIDDFGTGHASLAQVKRLQVDALKVDRSFVAGLPASEEDRAIVEAVITLGRALGLDVVAEGVETEEQLAALREADCEQVQGFLFSKPLEREELIELAAGAESALRPGA